MWRDASHMDLPTTQMQEKQHVIRYQPPQRPDLGGEEIGGDEHLQVRADELLPGGGGLALWRWRDAMALEDVGHRLGTDRQAEVGQGSDNPVIAPRTIVLGHADNQGLQLWVDLRSPWSLALGEAVELLGHQFAVPAENGLGLDDGGHFRQRLLPQLVADLGQSLPLAVTQPHTSLELGAEETIFRD
jgi:hypothetical protein